MARGTSGTSSHHQGILAVLVTFTGVGAVKLPAWTVMVAVAVAVINECGSVVCGKTRGVPFRNDGVVRFLFLNGDHGAYRKTLEFLLVAVTQGEVLGFGLLGHGVDPACGEVEFLSTVKRRCGAADLFGQGEAALLGVFVCEFNGADGVHTKGDLLCFLRVNGVAVSRNFCGFGFLRCRALGVGFEFLFVGDGLASRNLHGEFFRCRR